MEKQRVSFAVEGISIVGELYLPHDKEGPWPPLCICHGIPSGAPPDPKDGGYPLLAEKFSAAGFATLIFSFRGTGASGGNFDIMGWVKDLQGAINYLHSFPGVDKSRLSVMGFSGGAAVSTYVAAHDPRLRQIILCACPAEFGTLRDKNGWEFSVDHFRRIGIIRDKGFPSSLDDWIEGFRHITPLKWVAQIAPRPLLLLQGAEDDVVEVSQVWRLYGEAREPKEIAVIEGAGHRLRLSDRAMDIALEWLTRQVALTQRS